MFYSVKIILLVLGSAAIIATAVPLIKNEWWWIRILDFPRLQIIVLDMAAITGFALLFDVKNIYEICFLILLIIVAVYQAYHIHFYTPFAKKQVLNHEGVNDADRVISLLVSNVLMKNRESEALIAVIKKADPDIMLFVETDSWWKDELDFVKETHPYTSCIPLDNTYGMLLYSRLRLINTKIMFLVQGDIPSVHTTVVLPSNDHIALHCLHPRPPAPQESTSSAPRDAELVMTGKMVKENYVPAIVMGDMNDVAWSNTSNLFQKISGLLDPRIGRGWYATFNAFHFWLRWPLDHMFHSVHFKVVDIQRMPKMGSDHFPMYLKLMYAPEEKSDHVKPEMAAGDLKEAKEKIEKAEEKEEKEIREINQG